MNLTKIFAPAAALVAMVGGTLAPATADAQTRRDLQRRQQKKNEWRNLAYGAGAVGLYGLLKGDRNLAILGLGGAAYSANRYEQDRRSQRHLQDDYYTGRHRTSGFSSERRSFNSLRSKSKGKGHKKHSRH